jgi:hypothetical protein
LRVKREKLAKTLSNIYTVREAPIIDCGESRSST